MAHDAAPEREDVEQPLELILARNLISIISIAALLTDSDGRIVFFNERRSAHTRAAIRAPRSPPADRPAEGACRRSRTARSGRSIRPVPARRSPRTARR